MNKEDKDDMKTMVIITIVVSVLALVGKQVYNHFNPTREEQAQKAALKLQKAFKEKMQDAIIQAAEDLEQETQANKSKNEKTIVQETREHAIMETRQANGSQVIPESLQTKRERPIVEPQGVDQVETSLKQDSQVESTGAGVTVFGITIGKTTGKEILNKFSVIEEKPVIESVTHRALILNTNDFFSEKLHVKQVYIILDQQGIVEQLTIIFSGQHFQKLHSSLSQKYRLTYKEDPFVGDHTAYYTKDNIIIALHQPHMGGLATYLTYVTKNLDGLCNAYKKKYQEQEKQHLYDQL